MSKHYTAEEHKAWMQTLHARPAGAGIVLLAPDGRAICVKATYKRYWTFPGGKIDDGEHPKAAAIRETAEEVGIEVRPEDVSFVLTVSQLVDDIYSYYFLFEAAVTQEQLEAIRLAEGEMEAWKLIDLDLKEIEADERIFSILVKLYASGSRGYDEFNLKLIETV